MTKLFFERAMANTSSNGALGEALKLAATGIPCFPCRGSKRPACPHGFKEATANLDELRQLWRRSPGELIGVPTGEPSGFFVLDIDSVRHPEAAGWLSRNASRLPDTRRHRTRSGGLHFLFQHHEGLKSSVSRLAHGVDTRGCGGCIIWWPAHLGLAADHHFVTSAQVPDWLVAALTPPPPALVSCKPVAQAASSDRLQGILAVVASAREGERNQLTFWGACRIYDMLTNRALDHHTGADALAALAEAASRTGLPMLEIERTITSAARHA
jgi:Bifunctional DNA primase/polymerase, N-terminal